MTKFKNLGLNDKLLNAIEDMGFDKPSAIQEKCIPYINNTNTDLIAISQTGTGKTAAFSLPILNNLNLDVDYIQALILCPTRELCIQISNEIIKLSKYYTNIKILPIYGGSDIIKQINLLKNNPSIIIGTPGRTIDLINRKKLKLDNISWLVLDEADEMLNMGFREDIHFILDKTSNNKNILLFSATMPHEVRNIISKYMDNPIEIKANKINTSSKNISHEVYLINSIYKYNALKRIIDFYPYIYCIIFTKTRKEAKDIAIKLISDGYNADAIHGDLSQSQRDLVMNKFRNKNIKILIATDVAARGIDVNNLTHVINYTLPEDFESYIHRSGRTGRAGKTGVSIILTNNRYLKKIKELKNIINSDIKFKNIPTVSEICKERINNLIEKIEYTNIDDSLIDKYIENISLRINNIDSINLMKKILTIELYDLLNYYNKENIDDNKIQNNKNILSKKNDYTIIKLNLGIKNKFSKRKFITTINKNSRKYVRIGKIDIKEKYSIIQVYYKDIDTLLQILKYTKYNSKLEVLNKKQR